MTAADLSNLASIDLQPVVNHRGDFDRAGHTGHTERFRQVSGPPLGTPNVVPKGWALPDWCQDNLIIPVLRLFGIGFD